MEKIISYSKIKNILLPFVSIIGIGIVLYNFPNPFIPDFLKIRNNSNINDLFSLIISSLITVIGVYVSVSLIIFEILKQKSGLDIQKIYLKNHNNTRFISASLSSIIFIFIASLIVSNNKLDNSKITLIYYSICLFILIILFLVPVAFNLFSSLTPEKIAVQEINKLKENSLITINKNTSLDEHFHLAENDPLFIVEQITITLISVSDQLKAKLLIEKTSDKLFLLIANESDEKRKKSLTDKLIDYYIRIIDYAIQQPNNSVVLKSIWNSIERNYNKLIETKTSTEVFSHFRINFIGRYFNKLISYNEEESVFIGLVCLKNIIENHILNNMPEDSKISDFHYLRSQIENDFTYPKSYDSNDSYNSNKWREISSDFIDIISKLIRNSISKNKPEIVNKAFTVLDDLNLKLYHSDIGEYKKMHFYLNTSAVILDYAYYAFKRNLFYDTSEAKSVFPHIFKTLIKKENPSARTILQRYCNFLIKLQKIDKLDHWFLGGVNFNLFTTRGDLGEILYECARKYNNSSLQKEYLEDCIKTLLIFKENFERNISNDESKQYYGLIKWQFENMLEAINLNNEPDKKMVSRIQDIIISF